MRVLFIENETEFAAAVGREFLEDHYLTVVGTVQDAFRLLNAETTRFDCIMVDQRLDDGLGSQIVEALVKRGFRGPIIATATLDQDNVALRAAGATHTCKKAELPDITALLASLTPPEPDALV